MGDQCVNIAKLIPLSGSEPPVRVEVLEALQKMGACARSEVAQSKSAFSRREVAMHMILVARALERIGDNAVDIGEQVAFVVTGLFREFSDSSHPADRPEG